MAYWLYKMSKKYGKKVENIFCVLFTFGVCLLLMALGWVLGEKMELFGMGMALEVCSFLWLLPISPYLLFCVILKEKEELEYRDQREAARKKTEEFNLFVKEGKWTFPAEECYRRCSENHVTKLTNEFEYEKVKAITEQLIRETCPEADLACFQQYLTKESLQKYMRQGKPQVEKAAQAKLEESKKIRSANATAEEAKFIRRAGALSDKTGCDKRIAMLNDLLEDCDKRIQELRDGEEAMVRLGMIYAGMQKKEKNWAAIGGFAEGLAGPAAGIMAATDAMRDNNEIRRYNEEMRQASMDIMKGAFNSSSDRYKLEKEKGNIQKKIEEAKTKVSLTKPTAKEIWKHFRVIDLKVFKGKSGVLQCTVSLCQDDPFHLNVPEGVNMVVDGTLMCDIWMDGKYGGAAIFPLPLYGIPCNTSSMVTLDGMCGNSMEYDGQYKMEMKKEQNLWIMEA